jgi:hypothetical protein
MSEWYLFSAGLFALLVGLKFVMAKTLKRNKKQEAPASTRYRVGLAEVSVLHSA